MIVNYLFTGIVFIHGLIHLMGYSKSFHYSELKNITEPISKPVGVLWITACILFIATAILFLAKKDFWWMIGVAAIILSQLVIVLSWNDARFGTIANVLILLFILWKKLL